MHPGHVLPNCQEFVTCSVSPIRLVMGYPQERGRAASVSEKTPPRVHARAQFPMPAAKSVPSGAHSKQTARESERRTRHIAWPSRRRNRFLHGRLRFLTPPNAWLLPPTGTACAWLRGRQVRSRSPIGTGTALAHAFYAREPRAPPPRRHIFRVPAPPAADSVQTPQWAPPPRAGHVRTSAPIATVLRARTELTSGDPNHTRPAPTARSATPGRGCHHPPAQQSRSQFQSIRF